MTGEKKTKIHCTKGLLDSIQVVSMSCPAQVSRQAGMTYTEHFGVISNGH
jgi:hypothetical protein